MENMELPASSAVQYSRSSWFVVYLFVRSHSQRPETSDHVTQELRPLRASERKTKFLTEDKRETHYHELAYHWSRDPDADETC